MTIDDLTERIPAPLTTSSAGFGRAVRQFRETRQISQEELAQRVNLHRTYISDIERGTRNPTLKVLWRLADAFEIKPSILVKVAEDIIINS